MDRAEEARRGRRAVFRAAVAVVVLFVTAVVAPGLGSSGGDSRPPPRGTGVAHLGAWSFRLDPRDAGLAAGWPRRPPRMRRVEVPHVAHASRIAGPRGRRVHRGSVAWYRVPVRATRDGDYALEVGSANRDATVWLDGHRVCAHTGAYEPFTCPLPLRAGRRHTVMLRVDWRLERAPPADRRRAWFNWGGLAWPVRIVPLGPSTLSAPLVVTRLSARGRARVEVRVTIRNRDPRRRDLRVHGVLTRAHVRVPLVFSRRRLAGGARAVLRARAVVQQPALWSPRHPRLYRLRLSVPGETSLVTRVGLREVRWDGGRLRLNGRPLRLVGASLPPDVQGRGDALRPADQDRIIADLRRVGANATRAQSPLSDGMLRRLDEAGILVWQHVGRFDPAGAFGADTPARRREAHRDALATVLREAVHPSVVAWSLGNEVAGQGHPRGQATYVDALARGLHAADPGRPVAVDIWGRRLPTAPGRLYRNLDAVGVTSYVGWYERAAAPEALQEAWARKRLDALARTFPGMPIVVSEFGAAAAARNPTGLPGGEAYQARLLARRVRTLAAHPRIAGMLVFALRDYAYRPGFDGRPPAGPWRRPRFPRGLNTKGLFRYDGTARPSAAAVRRVFARVRRTVDLAR